MFDTLLVIAIVAAMACLLLYYKGRYDERHLHKGQTIMLAVSFPDNNTIPVSITGTDADGLPTGGPIADATLTADNEAAVTILAGPTPGTFTVALNPGNDPLVTTTVLTATDPASGETTTATITWAASTQTAIGIQFGTPVVPA